MPLRTRNSWPPPRKEMNWVLRVSPSVTSEGFLHSRSVTHEFGKMPKTLSRKLSRKHLSTYRSSKGNPPSLTWLTRIAINEALISLRRRRALHEVPADDSSGDHGTTPAPDLPDPSPAPQPTYLPQYGPRILSAP